MPNKIAESSLNQAIEIAKTGLKGAQALVSTTTQNLSESQVEGTSRKHQSLQTNFIASQSLGVTPSQPFRKVDAIQVKQIRTQESITNRTAILNSYHRDIMLRMGNPSQDKGTRLTQVINEFSTQLHKLSTTPEISQCRSDVFLVGKRMAQEIRVLSDNLQELRKAADAAIELTVQDINQNLLELEQLNKSISQAFYMQENYSSLLDKRDKTLRDISQYLDIRVQFRGDESVDIFTKGEGYALLMSQAQTLSHQPTAINATAAYPATINGILIDNDPAKDITLAISQGQLAGFIEMRDSTLPNLQAELDELTGRLRDGINAVHNRGTAPAPPNLLTSTRVFTGAADVFAGTGTVRISVVDNTAGATKGYFVSTYTLDLTTVNTVQDIINSINLNLAGTATATYNVVTNKVELQAVNANHGVAMISMTGAPEAQETGTGFGFSHYFGFNDFFVTGTTFSGVATGIANQLQLHREDLNTITTGKLSTVTPLPGLITDNIAISAGDNSNALDLAQALTTKHSFALAGSLLARDETFSNYAASIASFAANEAKQSFDAAEHETEILELNVQRFYEQSGINSQEELLRLVQLQAFFNLNAKSIAIIGKMLDSLIEIVT